MPSVAIIFHQVGALAVEIVFRRVAIRAEREDDRRYKGTVKTRFVHKRKIFCESLCLECLDVRAITRLVELVDDGEPRADESSYYRQLMKKSRHIVDIAKR